MANASRIDAAYIITSWTGQSVGVSPVLRSPLCSIRGLYRERTIVYSLDDRWISLHPSPSCCTTVLASGEECRVFPLFWCASNQARRCLFKRAGALSIGCNTPYYTQLLVLLSRLLLKHTSAHRANTTARDIPLSRAFTQHLYLLWQFSQCTIYLKL